MWLLEPGSLWSLWKYPKHLRGHLCEPSWSSNIFSTKGKQRRKAKMRFVVISTIKNYTTGCSYLRLFWCFHYFFSMNYSQFEQMIFFFRQTTKHPDDIHQHKIRIQFLHPCNFKGFSTWLNEYWMNSNFYFKAKIVQAVTNPK